MKTYTIKPLEWLEYGWGLETKFATIFIPQYTTKIRMATKWGNSEHDTIEQAKAKAQELHEQELAKYLQELG